MMKFKEILQSVSQILLFNYGTGQFDVYQNISTLYTGQSMSLMDWTTR